MGGRVAWKHEKNKEDLQPIIMPEGPFRSNLQLNNRRVVWYLPKVPQSPPQWQINNPNHVSGHRSYQTEKGWTGNKWILDDLWPRRKTQQLRSDQENIRKKCWSWLKNILILKSLII